jgi:hypothetical protein
MLILLNPFSGDPTTYTYTTGNYCPQVVPDQTIAFTINLVGDVTNYCPQTVPDYGFGVMSTQTDTNYCAQDYDGSPAVAGQTGKVVGAQYLVYHDRTTSGSWGSQDYNNEFPFYMLTMYGPLSVISKGASPSNPYQYQISYRDSGGNPQVATYLNTSGGGDTFHFVTAIRFVRQDGTSEANDILQDPNAVAAVPGFYDINFTINTSTQTDTNYCPQDSNGFYDSSIAADGTVLYCQQDTSGLPNPYDPIPADGTVLYCQQDTSGLPTP